MRNAVVTASAESAAHLKRDHAKAEASFPNGTAVCVKNLRKQSARPQRHLGAPKQCNGFLL
jgi:hypothetical protein